jgi:uncharacterized Zn-finger protein
MVVITVLGKRCHLRKHSLTHSGIKAFICNHNKCNKKFTQKSHQKTLKY